MSRALTPPPGIVIVGDPTRFCRDLARLSGMVAAQFAPLQASEDLRRLAETLTVGSAAQLGGVGEQLVQLVAGPKEGETR